MASVQRFTFSFHYKGGSFYTGTVTDDGSLGYSPGELIATPFGTYAIGVADGPVAIASGSVAVSLYHDVVSGLDYVPSLYPTGQYAGGGGLGTEYDQIDAARGSAVFGRGGQFEVSRAAAALGAASGYAFTFTYADGSFYTGSVYDDGSSNYSVGARIYTPNGVYEITGVATLPPSSTSGTVYTSTYYDSGTKTNFATYYGASNTTAGLRGLGGELDAVTGAQGMLVFGEGGRYEANQAGVTTYNFTFTYSDGRSYQGTVTDDGRYGYTVGQSIATAHGSYAIDAIASTTATTKPTVKAVGAVSIASYTTADGSVFTPYFTRNGAADGLSGLGSEYDFAVGSNGYLAIGGGGNAPSALYDFTFTYADGSFYRGTVVDDGTYKYSVGQTITTVHGSYLINDLSGATTQQVGTVFTSSYFDASSGLSFVPTAFAAAKQDGTAGLGSEYDTITGNHGTLPFGQGGAYEAKQGGSRLFDFIFTYRDGSTYTGTVSDDGSYGYHVGATIPSAFGSYYLFGTGDTTQAAGTVFTRTYYDATSHASYVPDLYAAGQASGDNGLGFEQDSTTGPAGTLAFGDAGALEARQAANTLFKFSFSYDDGSSYFGTVADDGSYGYTLGQGIPTANGVYLIYASTPTTQVAGTVTVMVYYDVRLSTDFTPTLYAAGQSDGDNGLGFELDYTDGAGGHLPFGQGGAYEAEQATNTLYNFYFRYEDGSFFYGTVSDSAGVYAAGDDIPTNDGFYHIYGAGGLTGQARGTVYVSSYYDISSRAFYTPVQYAAGSAASTAGLGNEVDYTHGSGGTQRFGSGGQYEARQTGATLYSFTFTYGDGSYFVGTVSDDGTYGYQVNQTISTPFQGAHFTITGSQGATNLKVGLGVITTYYDALNAKFFKALFQQSHDYGVVDGLTGQTFDEIQDGSDINHPTRDFGFRNGGLYEPNAGFGSTFLQPDAPTADLVRRAAAAADPATTLYNFIFTFGDGSRYSGTVADDGTLGYAVHQVIATAHGSYEIVGSAGTTALASGSVAIAGYYDMSSDTGFVPDLTAAGQADGSAGLGSEQDTITGAKGTLAFGLGGAAQASQGIALFDVTFTYADGNSYIGTVADDGQYGYVDGQTIITAHGSYTLTASGRTTGQASGTVTTTLYFDAATRASYTPNSALAVTASGTGGLGRESDSVTAFGRTLPFGQGGAQEAHPGTALFHFAFTYRDGSQYSGSVADDGTYGYSVGQTITTGHGAYVITDSAGAVAKPAGAVSVSRYLDATTGAAFTPDLAPAGTAGLGTEIDSITGPQGTRQFGQGGTLEASQAANLFDFTFTYADKSFYTGTVADDGRYGYANGETITTPYGAYTLGPDSTSDAAAGTVHVTSYFDVATQASYVPTATAAGAADGTGGLRSERDSIALPTGASSFGEGGLYEGGSVPCYCAGTRLATPDGEMAVEALRIGDLVATASGALRPIRWIGTRSYDGRFAGNNADLLPIRFAAGALGGGLPRRDLLVSPLHAMFLDGVLIPAHLLVNGRSIVQCGRMARIDYFHVELDSHDVLLAEGAPAESFVDCDSRNMFQNATDYASRHPDDRRPGWQFCAPRIEDGLVLARVRLRLAALAGLDGEHADDAPADGALVGYIDAQDRHAVSGWAFDATRPHSAVRLELLVDGRLAGTTVANTLRVDLKRAGLGDGRCAFTFPLRQALPDGPHDIIVRRIADGAVLTEVTPPVRQIAA